MSHEIGRVRLHEEGEVLGFFEYDGTVDIACTRIAASEEDAWRTFRSPESKAECLCGEAPYDVWLETGYGGGLGWWSRACLACGAVTGPRNRFEAEGEERERNEVLFGEMP